MSRRALLGALAMALALSSSAHADACPVSRIDVADWALVRSARVPGFTLRLPRSFARDTVAAAGDVVQGARWSDASRGRLTMWRSGAGASTPIDPGGTEHAGATRCETRVGAATATIVSYAAGPSEHVVRARIAWPDGESVEVNATAADREHVEQLLAAIRTIRRAGA